MINSNSKGTIIITYWLVYCVTAHNGGGYWTTRGYANSRIANSRTELLADYINDIDDCVAGRILKFADDTKIYHTVYSEEDVRALQFDLCNLVEWSKEWQMLFNADKCRVIHE